MEAEPGERPVVVRQAQQWQPLFSLWPRALLNELERAWAEGQRSPLSFLRSVNARTLEFAETLGVGSTKTKQVRMIPID